MRRADREMGADFAFEVFDMAPFVTVSMVNPKGEPYSVPLSLVREGEKTFYFHCAAEGEKLDCIRLNQDVYLSAVTLCRPTVSPREGEFTLQYKSATARGVAEIVADFAEKTFALEKICQKFLPEHMNAFQGALEQSLHLTAVVKITLTEPPVGKRKLYGPDGNELKWGQAE